MRASTRKQEGEEELHFGHDFGRVRGHMDAKAADSAREVLPASLVMAAENQAKQLEDGM